MFRLKSFAGRSLEIDDSTESPSQWQAANPGDPIPVSGRGPNPLVLEPTDLPNPVKTQDVYVSIIGNDVTGDGSISKPYRTIGHAEATILDASSTKPYRIIVARGDYVENIALKPWIIILGDDPSEDTATQYPVILDGNLTLGAGFGVADPAGNQAWITQVEVVSTITFDYVAVTPAAFAMVSFTGCHLDSAITLTGSTATGHRTEFAQCQTNGDFTQIGGTVVAYNCNGIATGALLLVQAAVGTSAFYFGQGGSWAGDIRADMNGAVGVQCIINLQGTSASRGAASILATAAASPAILANIGDLPENLTLGGGAAAVLTPQMRVSHQFVDIAPGGAFAINPGLTQIPLAFAAGLFGATPIETMHMSAAPVGTNWAQLAPQACTVWFYWYTNAGVPTCVVNIYNPGIAFNIVNPIDLNTYGYLPLVL